MLKPMVSICCMTFNHEKYLQQCLDGFVMQKTTFPFEILVHDDASTDKTAEIVKEYEVKYPHLFRCVYQKENQFAKQNTLFNILLPMASGKYIALCEGDDYWTDQFKLQKQIDFLENHHEFSMSCHNIEVNGNVFQASYIKNVKEFYTAKELASGEIAISTLSIVFRNYKLTYPDFFSKTPVGDFPLFVLLSQYGRIKYFPEIMGVRRVHENGLWSAADKSTKLSYLLITVYYMIGNYNEEINKILIQYHLRLIAESIKEGVSPALYPKEMKWVIKIMSYYTQVRTILRNIGILRIFKLFWIKKQIPEDTILK
jgi:glycosyltransferase involved in cell wall biosynthesis